MIYDSTLWINDIDEVLKVVPEIDSLIGKTVLVTGGTGLVCSPLVDLLIRYNETHENSIHIVVAGRSKERFKLRFKPFIHRKYLSFSEYNATTGENNFDGTFDYLIHGASNSSPDLIQCQPVETLLDNIIGLKALFDYAKKTNSKRVLYISSSEIYGQNDNVLPYKENEYGYIDFLNPRSSYSIAKCASENLCISYGKEYKIDSVIVRPGHIFGPSASFKDNHIASLWCREAIQGNSIVMKSSGKSIRSYCYCLDCAAAIIKVLIKGHSFNAYNISDNKSITDIKRMANIISSLANVPLITNSPTADEKDAYNPMINSSLDGAKIQSLGWHAVFDIVKGLDHTLQIMRKI